MAKPYSTYLPKINWDMMGHSWYRSLLHMRIRVACLFGRHQWFGHQAKDAPPLVMKIDYFECAFCGKRAAQ